MILELPRPNEQELAPFNKNLYYERMLNIDYTKKYKMTQSEFLNWIHHNYSSVLLEGKSINSQQLKKLG
jgi:uncharacterized HAD superfamily protein